MVCEKGGDETDGTEKKILLSRMKFVIKSLHKTSNPFHSFMNVINLSKEVEEKAQANTVIEALEKISKGGYISQEDFINFKARTAGVKTEETTGCCGKKAQKPRTSEETLLEYIEEIADGEKIYMSWTMLIFFMFTLGLFLVYSCSGDWRDRLEFDV